MAVQPKARPSHKKKTQLAKQVRRVCGGLVGLGFGGFLVWGVLRLRVGTLGGVGFKVGKGLRLEDPMQLLLKLWWPRG